MVNRLFGICYQLMQRDKIPAKELAERYEVSMRTIYRDVEILSMAGVPIYASKGRSGGISLLDHSLIDKMFITPEEKSRSWPRWKACRRWSLPKAHSCCGNWVIFSRRPLPPGFPWTFPTGAGEGRSCLIF